MREKKETLGTHTGTSIVRPRGGRRERERKKKLDFLVKVVTHELH